MLGMEMPTERVKGDVCWYVCHVAATRFPYNYTQISFWGKFSILAEKQHCVDSSGLTFMRIRI